MIGAAAIAEDVRARRTTATAVVDRTLALIGERDPALNCFTDLLAERARARARALDAILAAGGDPGPLAGVPFGVKNLFDLAGLVTRAGSRIERDRPPASRDADAVAALEDAGAILVGALNMDEYAYGFSTENAHDGPTRNPHDPGRIAGGSSGGSAAAVAAGMVPLTLGSDTNGSVRIPAALCGVYGLKPSFGRLSRRGTYPFVDSLDHVGLFAGDVADLAAGYTALAGEGAAPLGDAPLPRMAMLGGWFTRHAGPEIMAALDHVAQNVDDLPVVDLPGSEVARSAAFCITAAEGGARHLPNLRTRPLDFDPATRDRLIAGALLPAAVLAQAQRVRAWYRAEAQRLFEQYDVLIAPATFCTAPALGQATLRRDGIELPIRANLGLYTQPLSFIGLPVLAAPVAGVPGLPIGVQLVAGPGREALLFETAAALERAGAIGRHPLPRSAATGPAAWS